jgi:hypothetical protein
MSEEDFIVVVPEAPIPEADLAFEEWLESHGLTRGDLAAEDLRVDTGRHWRVVPSVPSQAPARERP